MRRAWRRWLLVGATSMLPALGPCLTATQQNIISGAFEGLTLVLVELAEQQIAATQ